jgi:hypothetical protein
MNLSNIDKTSVTAAPSETNPSNNPIADVSNDVGEEWIFATFLMNEISKSSTDDINCSSARRKEASEESTSKDSEAVMTSWHCVAMNCSSNSNDGKSGSKKPPQRSSMRRSRGTDSKMVGRGALYWYGMYTCIGNSSNSSKEFDESPMGVSSERARPAFLQRRQGGIQRRYKTFCQRI